MSERFYADLESFSDARDVCDRSHYTEVPDGWEVVITDVEGSTKAIEAGRYREVNMVGAATITAARNASPGLELPYVFGGDGATLLVPASHLPAVRDALLGVQRLAMERFGLGLRVGGVSTDELHRDGVSVLLAKLEIAHGVFLAMFSGGGLSAAEAKVKGDARYLYTSTDMPEPDLTGLECRWNPLAAENGEVLSVLVRASRSATKDEPAIYREVIAELARLVGSHEAMNPVNPQNLRVCKDTTAVAREHRLKGARAESILGRFLAVLKLWLLTHLGNYFMNKRKVTNVTDWGKYRDSIVRHSDYWKYDDTLRFVIDVTPAQKVALVACFDAFEARGEIVYGVHAAKEALMTCVVFDRDVNHVHFIDGGNGGYAKAAKSMKSKLKG